MRPRLSLINQEAQTILVALLASKRKSAGKQRHSLDNAQEDIVEFLECLHMAGWMLVPSGTFDALKKIIETI